MKFCLIKAVSLVFGKSVPVSREMHAYPFLSLLAEVRSSALVNMVSICMLGVLVKKNINDLQLPRCLLSRLEATWDSLLESPSLTCALRSSERSASAKLPQKEEDID